MGGVPGHGSKAPYRHAPGRCAAFAYPRPRPLARRLVTDRIAFWGEVRVVD